MSPVVPVITIFNYTGILQHLLLPNNAKSVSIVMWVVGGAGTSTNNIPGGPGGFTVTGGETLDIIVGGAGISGALSTTNPAPGGFGGGANGGSGGGRSSVGVNNATEIITAGGGGSWNGGNGGRSNISSNGSAASGGGGSAHGEPVISNFVTIVGTSNVVAAPQNTHADYVTGVGKAGNGLLPGGNGLVIVRYMS